MTKFERVTVIGAGVIGSSWAALFLAGGLQVEVFEPAPDGERAVRDYIKQAWPTLEALGLTPNGDPQRIRFHASARDAVRDAQFVQESVPEQLSLKLELFAEIEPYLSRGFFSLWLDGERDAARVEGAVPFPAGPSIQSSSPDPAG